MNRSQRQWRRRCLLADPYDKAPQMGFSSQFSR
jgi:hypothetical protein